jgi:hypothetical protein
MAEEKKEAPPITQEDREFVDQVLKDLVKSITESLKKLGFEPTYKN